MRVLIVKIGAVGDVVMALPMLPAARSAGASRITWLCGQNIAPLLRLIDDVDEVITVDERALFRGGRLGQIRQVAKLWLGLLRRSFDLVIIAHPDVRYRVLTWPLVGVKRTILGSTGRKALIRGRHHSGEYARLVTGAEGPDVPPANLPVVRPELPDHLAAVLSSTAHGNVALAPGGARNILRENALRRWPLKSYVELAAMLVKFGANVIVTGDPNDAWVMDAFHGLPVQDLIGKTGLVELVAVYAACDAVVTHDSGPLHLAQLTRTPLVALFGPTNPREFILHPSDGHVFWGGAALSCRPCYDGRDFAACRNNLCLQEISVDSVYAAVVDVLCRIRQAPAQPRSATSSA
jgi:heptosyltransferase-2